ncbi:LysR family transcriptional regulator [Hartmannibacter diazotrophicus]|nr:LysR family transcriptional regulator [Hartmannibacter diazotrophicus]
MRNIDNVHIRRLDMSLLVVFEALMRSGKMSAVADDLGLTQSAVSHAVGRMREIFRDPLFLRNGSGVTPTPRARQLADPISEALASIRLAIQIGHGFDPATSRRNFAIAAVDSAMTELAPELLTILADEAPSCCVTFMTMPMEAAIEAIATGAIDLAIGAFSKTRTPDGRTVPTALYKESFLVMARRGHPRIGDTLDLGLYCALDHILVSFTGDRHGAVDQVLGTIGAVRRIAMVMPQFIPAFAAVAKSDAILTAPLRVCRKLGDYFDLVAYPPPIQLPDFQMQILRHNLSMGDPAINWLEAHVRRSLLGSSPVAAYA